MTDHARKRRFGVSIPEDLADKLDKLSIALNMDRSSIVREALREYVHDHLHYIVPHQCVGVLVIVGADGCVRKLAAFEQFKGLVTSYNHVHVDGSCLEVVVVSGDSSEIAKLHRTLSGLRNCTVRYIPVLQSALPQPNH